MISVLMPVYNNSQYLAKSIESILRQSEQDFELIIIDDGSTEPVADIILGYGDERIRAFSNRERIGVPKTLNFAIGFSRGDLLCRQDSDDISHPDRLRLLKDTGSPFVTSRYGRIDRRGLSVSDKWMAEANRIKPDAVSKKMRQGNIIVGGAPMWSRDVLDAVGSFNERLLVAQEYNYWLRILKMYPIAIVDEVLYYHRKHAGSHRHHGYCDKRGNLIDFDRLARELA